MSQENVEIVRQYFPAYDRSGVDGLAEFWHPDINWRAVEGALDDVGLMEGPDAMRDYLRQWEETFESGRMEAQELIDAGDQVVALVRGIGRMKDSDAEIDLRYAIVFTIRDGKIATGREYFTREEALKAVGCGSSASDEKRKPV
jgi:ketosteroid isomerase-like protein